MVEEVTEDFPHRAGYLNRIPLAQALSSCVASVQLLFKIRFAVPDLCQECLSTGG